jgi:hypothetical protein
VDAFDSELTDCLEVVLGKRPPKPEYEPHRFLRHWLGERNLGLVPIANAGEFDWPGHWLARVRAADGDHAVVMFGSPSGPVHDPSYAIASGGTIVEGWLVAPLDLHRPAGDDSSERVHGAVEGILVAAAAEQPLARVETVRAEAGRGLEGDRYFDGRGTFSGPGRGYELTLVEAEELDAVGLTWEQARRNVVTRGVRLDALVGRRFTIGPVQCVGRRPAEPCSHLDRLSGPGLLRPLVHRAGLRADILESGSIAVGDPVVALD